MIRISIGICAFNEQANIASLLMQITKQNGNFNLEQILVLTDGCTDKTANIVSEMSVNNKMIKLFEFKKRKGKVCRLNQIYKLNKSDILITFDGDIALKDNYVLDNVVKFMDKNKRAMVIAIHQIPIRPKTFIGKSIYAGYEFWDMTRLSVKNQDHIQNLYGAATVYRKSFSNKFRFPKEITDDRGYLYIKAKEINGFRYFKGTEIYYLPVSTLHDFWKLSDRSFDKNKDILRKYFGTNIDKMYYLPSSVKLKSITNLILKDPIYGLMGLLLNLLVRLFPVKDNLYEKKMWEISESTKKLI